MNAKKKRQLFDLSGGAVIFMWLVMIGSLIGKTVLFSPGEETAQAAISGVIDETHRAWMEIYLKDSKIGYSVTRVSPFGDDYLIFRKRSS